MARSTIALLAGFAMLVVAGLVHIIALLALPGLAPDDAFSRIAAALPAGAVALLPRVAPGTAGIPFRDPAMASAACRYDLSQGPMRVAVSVSDRAFLALSVHSRWGLAFYGLTDRSALDGKLEVVILTEAQRDKAESQDNEEEPVKDVRVVAPDIEGFVQFDAAPRVGGYAMAEQALRSISCKIERDF